MGHQCNDVGDCAAADREDEGVGHWRVISGVFAGAPTLAVHEDEGGETARVAGFFHPFTIEFSWEHHFDIVMNLCGIWRGESLQLLSRAVPKCAHGMTNSQLGR